MNKRRILVVDDESGFTHLLKHVLFKYEIKEVNDSQSAFTMAREFRPDLILMDLIMPGLDGLDLAAQFRADHVLKNVPVVILTAVLRPDESVGKSPVFQGYPALAKPVKAAELIACIETHLPPVAS